jgi:hypothetical protein
MRCFNHRDREAVGSCKACSKGLCAECAVDLGHGLSCRGEHEATVESYRTMLNRNTKVMDAARVNGVVGPLFFIALGVLFGIYGLITPQGLKGLSFPLGGAFILFGIVGFVRNRSTYGRNAK